VGGVAAAWLGGAGRWWRWVLRAVSRLGGSRAGWWRHADARRDRDGSGKIRWWLVEAGVAVKSGQERTLTLTPLTYDEREGPCRWMSMRPRPFRARNASRTGIVPHGVDLG
jgi:hypothetical protein